MVKNGVKKNWVELLLIVLYKIVIEVNYVKVLSVKYDYYGLRYNPNLLKCGISILLLVIVSVLTIRIKTPIIKRLIIMLLIFIYIPTNSYYWLNNMDTKYILFLTASICTLIIVSSIRFTDKEIKIKRRTNKGHVFFNVLILLYFISSAYVLIKVRGIDSRAFNFDKIYELRAETEVSALQGYLLNWNVKSIAPFLFSYYIYRKKYKWGAIMIIIQIVTYLSYGNKAILISSIFMILSVTILKNGHFLKRIVIVITSPILFTTFLPKFVLSDILIRLIPFRMLFVPAQIQYQHFDFFDGIQKAYYSEGLIGRMFSLNEPFSERIAIVIGRLNAPVFGSYNHANTGVFADAFDNGGFLAMLIISVLFGILLILIKMFTKNIPEYISFCSLSYITFVFNDVGLQTAFLTGGLFFLIIFLYLLNDTINPAETVQKIQKNQYIVRGD